MKITIKNAEELIFKDAKIWKKIPELIDHRNQWSISCLSPTLKQTGKKAILDFLKKVDENILSEYFGETVQVDRLDYHMVKSIEFDINENIDLNEFSIYTGFSSYREKDRLKIVFWR